MVATNEGRRSNRTNAKKSKRDPEPSVPADDHAAATGPSPATRSGTRSAAANRIMPPRVSARQAERRILALGVAVDTLDVRERLRRLAGLVGKDGRNARRMAFLEAAIGECLDEVTRSSSPASRWNSCEAATWALAWMARTKRAGGSAGGQNGLADVLARLGTTSIPRLRLGIGPVPAGWKSADYVLGKFPKADRERVAIAVERAADAAEEWIALGIQAAMNKFN